MKAWTNLALIPTPKRIKALPKDDRGYPVPFFASVIGGKPDFRVIDPVKWRECVEQHRCSICGKGLGKRIAFVGGPRSIENRLFTDAPMHPECATYALQACPFMAAPKFGYHGDVAAVAAGEAKTISAVTTQRPERFGLGLTKGFRFARLNGSNDIVLQAAVFDSVSWWAYGQKVISDNNQ
jgi:hypothetical protein|tara:strand:+ start:23843 stop:24385 length:543 start_codon:yes stop_codon:yes gene_type:complete